MTDEVATTHSEGSVWIRPRCGLLLESPRHVRDSRRLSTKVQTRLSADQPPKQRRRHSDADDRGHDQHREVKRGIGRQVPISSPRSALTS